MSEPIFYLRNISAGFVGNSPLFWEKNGSGYTPNIDEAKLFTSEEADRIIKSTESSHKFKKYTKEQVFSASYRTVDIQKLERN